MTLTTTDLSFEDIDFRSGAADVCAVGVNGARMRLARACATRQALAWEVRERVVVAWIAINGRVVRNTIDSLIGNSADVASIVGVRPLDSCQLPSRGVNMILTVPSKLAP